NAATKVPSGSNKSGGTKINKNEDTKSNQSTEAYNAVKGAVVSVINKQASSSDDNDILSIFGADSDSSSSNSSSLQTASEGSGVIYKKSGNAAYIVTNN
ncbi:serine protease, partial [Bifidobacterium pseudocatenulatum]|nr:serine protease [Bifidobacterium pseudocatenulatum]